jgi:translation initiation factor IF-3
VRVIGPDGDQLGILQSRQALSIAREQGLDLVMVSPTAQPPVCKIIDFGRYKYETEKQNKGVKKKQQEVKGINISPRIAEHDLQHLIKSARKFLDEGNKVRVVCKFKAREITHPEIGRKKLDFFANQLLDAAIVDRMPAMDNRQMIMVLNPKPQTGAKKNAKTEDKQDRSQAVQSDGDGKDNPPQVAQ